MEQVFSFLEKGEQRRSMKIDYIDSKISILYTSFVNGYCPHSFWFSQSNVFQRL